MSNNAKEPPKKRGCYRQYLRNPEIKIPESTLRYRNIIEARNVSTLRNQYINVYFLTHENNLKLLKYFLSLTFYIVKIYLSNKIIWIIFN